MKWLKLAAAAGVAWGLSVGCGSSDSNDLLADLEGGVDGSSAGSGGRAGNNGGSGTGNTAGSGVGGTGVGGLGSTGGAGNPDASADGSTGGSGPDGSTDAAPDATGPTFVCGTFGELCQRGADCCSGVCDPATNTCTSPLGQCSATGTSCAAATDCCSVSCVNGGCAAAACVSDNGACTTDAECCGQSCNGGTCTPLTTGCRTAGNDCTGNAQCCSGLCTNGKCDLRSSFCVQQGDICTRGEDCCTGRCDIASGAAAGTCGDPPSGSSNCNGRGVEGARCGTCNDCCSRLCAPFGPTGVFVCQPASGCHVNGDLCRQTSDCCGAAGTGLPGDGNVVCQKATGATLGICRNPMSCNPQGNVCHYQNYACSGSSSRNNCCEATGLSGRCMPDPDGVLTCNGFPGAIADCLNQGDQCSLCQLDALGIPRCNGLGECREPGETCASAADCCEGLPCIPDATGQLRCLNPPDGGDTCVPASGSCTINADCCPGGVCIRPSGSTQGTCGVVEPPGSGGSPGTGGVPGAGGSSSGGGPGSGGVTSAGGTPGSGGVTGAGGAPPQCSEYGQRCGATSECCNTNLGVACIDAICKIQL